MTNAPMDTLFQLIADVRSRVQWERELNASGYAPTACTDSSSAAAGCAPPPEFPSPDRQGPDVLFIRDADGADRPGTALLERIIGAMGLPPDRHRVISFNDLEGWLPQRPEPRVIVALGPRVTARLLKTDEPLDALRGRFHQRGDISVMPTWPPEQLLSDPSLKRPVWDDMKQVMALLQREERHR
jgi:DNA polymerase